MLVEYYEMGEMHEEGIKAILEQVYYVHPRISKAWAVENGMEIEFETGDCPDVEEAAIKASVKELIKATAISFAKVETVTLDSNDVKPTYAADPHPLLYQTGQVEETLPGVFVYSGAFLKLFRGLDALFADFAMNGLRGEEYECPTTVPLHSMMTNGYLSSFPQHGIFAGPARSDIAALKGITGRHKESEVDWQAVLDAPRQLLAPTVCYHLFEVFSGKTVSPEGKLLTALAKCHRYENKNMKDLCRVQTFTMREIVMFGTQEFVKESLDKIYEHAVSLMRSWGVAFSALTACDPFFGISSQNKRFFQSMFKLKVEMRFAVPYKDTAVSVASFNNHLDTLTSKYGISFPGGDKLHSGCVGYGYDRMALALMAQFGPDLEGWPRAVQNDLFPAV